MSFRLFQVIVCVITTLVVLAKFPQVVAGQVISAADLAQYYFPWSSAFDLNYPDRSYSSFSDVMDQGTPAIAYLKHSLNQFNFPFYTDFVQNGIPFLLVSRHEVATPVLMILTLILPVAYAINFYILVKIILGVVFLIYLLEHFKIDRYAQVVATIFFTSNSVIMGRIQDSVGTIYLLLPVVIYLFIRLIEGSKAAIFIFPLAIYWLFAAGYPPAFLLAIIYILFVALSQAVKQLRHLKVNNLVISFSATIILLIPLLLETYRYIYTEVDLGYRENLWNQGLSANSLVTLFYPWIFGEQSENFQFINNSIYLGTISLSLLFYGFMASWTRKTPLFFRFNLIYFIFLTMVMFIEDFRVLVLSRIPILNLVKASSQNIIWSFGAVLIISIGLHRLVQSIRQKKINNFVIFNMIVAVIFVVLNQVYGQSYRDLIRPLTILGLILVCVLILGMKSVNFDKNNYLLLVLALVIATDLIKMHMNWNWTIDSNKFYPDTAATLWLKENQGDQKIISFGTNFLSDAALSNNLRMLGGRGFFTKKQNDLYSSLDPGINRFGPTQKFFHTGTFNFENPLLDSLGIKYLVSSPIDRQISGIDDISNLPQLYPNKFREVFSGDDAYIVENMNSYGPYFVTCSMQKVGIPIDLQVSNQSESSYQMNNDSSYDYPDSQNSPYSSTCGVVIEKVYKQNNSLWTFIIKSATPSHNCESCYLIIANNYYEGLRAYINETQTIIQQVDINLMAIKLEPGLNKVDIRYDQRIVYLYFATLVIQLLFLGIAIYYSWQKTKKHKYTAREYFSNSKVVNPKK